MINIIYFILFIYYDFEPSIGDRRVLNTLIQIRNRILNRRYNIRFNQKNEVKKFKPFKLFVY